MKKAIAILLALVCMLGAAGCGAAKIDKTAPVFDTENIKSIAFYTLPNGDSPFAVPEEYLDEIAAWLATFRLDEKVKGDVLPPGANSISVEIVYKDGTSVKNGLSTFEVDGTDYFMSYEDAPQCYLDILEG